MRSTKCTKYESTQVSVDLVQWILTLEVPNFLTSNGTRSTCPTGYDPRCQLPPTGTHWIGTQSGASGLLGIESSSVTFLFIHN